jgi:predicted dehydrogenase
MPLPTALRKQWVLRAAAAGKHVVCEKPCAVRVADLEEMLESCRRHGVQFMDGVMFVHSQRLARMREALTDGRSVGQIRRIESAFSFGAPPEFASSNIRAQSSLEPHGCLGDLGWYCIRLTLWAMNWQMPRQVTGRVLAEMRPPQSPASAHVPSEFSAELLFEGGASAGLYCSFLAENQQWAVISGTKGYLRIEDFVLPFTGHQLSFQTVNSSYRVQGCDFVMKPGVRRIRVPESSHGEPNAQESNLFRAFADQVLSGRLNEDWPRA